MDIAFELVGGLKTKARQGVRKARSLTSREEVMSMVERFQEPPQEPVLVFADEHARIAWQTTQDVERIAASMPAEGARLNLQPVSFDEKHERRGLRAIFVAGTVIGTREDYLLVPERTVQILEQLGIRHTIGAKSEPHFEE